MEVLTECGLSVETSVFPDLTSYKECNESGDIHLTLQNRKWWGPSHRSKITGGVITFHLNVFNLVQIALTVVCFLALLLTYCTYLTMFHLFWSLWMSSKRVWSSNFCLGNRLGFCLHLVFAVGTAFQKISRACPWWYLMKCTVLIGSNPNCALLMV